MTCAAPRCDKPPHNGYLCASCVATLRKDLVAVPDLLADLEITISRQDKLSDAEKRPVSERPLPLRLGPMEAKRELTMRLAGWVSYLVSDYKFTPATNAAELATFLVAHLVDLQRDESAGDAADEIGFVVINSQRAVDKPRQHTFVGPCGLCGGDLYAHPKAKEVACRNPDCDAEPYDVATRREWLLRRAEGQLLTAGEMSRALPGLMPHDDKGKQRKLSPSMIRGLAHRGRLTQHPPHRDRPREPLYSVGELLVICLEREPEGRPLAS